MDQHHHLSSDTEDGQGVCLSGNDAVSCTLLDSRYALRFAQVRRDHAMKDVHREKIRLLGGAIFFACIAAFAAGQAWGAAQGGPPDLSGVYSRGLYMKPPPGIEAEVILPTGGVIPG